MRPAKGDRPTVLGTGLIAMDLIVSSGGTVTQSIGGTCGNVLTVLLTHGINARPVGKAGSDLAADFIYEILDSCKTYSSLVLRADEADTPRIVELAPANGTLRHRFAFVCPRCSRRLPRNLVMRKEQARTLEIDWSRVDLFFLDRVSPAAIYLAEAARNAGVMVMFEPPKSLSSARLNAGVSVADIVKYSSQDYRKELPDEIVSTPKLIIETRGENGLRYRLRQGNDLVDWIHLPSFDAIEPKDLAGAGDWCTAGFISRFVKQERTERLNAEDIEAALAYGQALAAISTCFIGPLGALFALSNIELVEAAKYVVERCSVPEWARRQGEEDRAFGPAWPINFRALSNVCEVCLMNVSK